MMRTVNAPRAHKPGLNVCGIVLLQGPKANDRLPACLDRLKHRGPDDHGIWSEKDISLGFTRLAINGEGPVGHQPHRHNGLIGAVNGEIYNHRELSHAFGLKAPNECDTHVVTPLLELRGSKIIDDLDGFYAAVVIDPSTRELICLRDHIGKKPLFVGHSQGELFITSELKALDQIDWFEPLPRGVAYIEQGTGRITRIAEHKTVQPSADIVSLIQEAVRKRMPRPGQPVGIFLSGGLDSSIVAAVASQLRDDIVYYTLGNSDGPDRRSVETIVEALDLRDVRPIALPSSTQLPELVRSVVYATESYNPSVVSNGLATYLLAREARRDNIKVILTGEGADELFGGYHSYDKKDPWRETRARLIDDLPITELRRLDTCTMAHGVEARCPFLDRAIRGFSERLTYEEIYSGEENKVTLRKSFEDVLPKQVLHRPKTSFDVGSGIRGEVVRHLNRNGKTEREELRLLWKRFFTFDASESYFHSYPVFDAAIDRRGETHR